MCTHIHTYTCILEATSGNEVHHIVAVVFLQNDECVHTYTHTYTHTHTYTCILKETSGNGVHHIVEVVLGEKLRLRPQVPAFKTSYQFWDQGRRRAVYVQNLCV